MKKIIILIFIFSVIANSQTDPEKDIKSSIIPIIRVTKYQSREGYLIKYPVGTAFLVADSTSKPIRYFLITAKHVIENDSITLLLFNYIDKNNQSSSVRRYIISRNEWKFNSNDSTDKNDQSFYYGYDIAISEIYLLRMQRDEEVLQHKPISVKNLCSLNYRVNDSAKVLAFPFVNEYNWDKGLVLGHIEIDDGIVSLMYGANITFDKNKLVKDLGEITIRNPKFRPGYSGGIVYKKFQDRFEVIGMAMGMSAMKNFGSDKYCVGFFVKAENILNVLKKELKVFN